MIYLVFAAIIMLAAFTGYVLVARNLHKDKEFVETLYIHEFFSTTPYGMKESHMVRLMSRAVELMIVASILVLVAMFVYMVSTGDMQSPYHCPPGTKEASGWSGGGVRPPVHSAVIQGILLHQIV